MGQLRPKGTAVGHAVVQQHPADASPAIGGGDGALDDRPVDDELGDDQDVARGRPVDLGEEAVSLRSQVGLAEVLFGVPPGEVPVAAVGLPGLLSDGRIGRDVAPAKFTQPHFVLRSVAGRHCRARIILSLSVGASTHVAMREAPPPIFGVPHIRTWGCP